MRVVSKDRTQIACWGSGSGPPLILVHGTTAEHSRWVDTVPLLDQTHTVYVFDRRGRGKSSDGEPYAIEREFEDVVAVVAAVAIHGPVDLLGHSFGALCALEAALLTTAIRRLILYEPLFPTGIPLYSPGVMDQMHRLSQVGESEAALVLALREVVPLSPEYIAWLRTLPSWPRRVTAAHTVLREMEAAQEYRFQPERFAKLTIPTLLLSGELSPPLLKGPTAAVRRALANAAFLELPGQHHLAMDGSPNFFCAQVLRFLVGGRA